MQKKRSSTSHSTIRIGKLKLFSKFLVFLVSILFLTSTIYIKEALAQSSIISSFPGRENLDYEILELYRQLKNLEVKIIPIDTELGSLKVNVRRCLRPKDGYAWRLILVRDEWPDRERIWLQISLPDQGSCHSRSGQPHRMCWLEHIFVRA